MADRSAQLVKQAFFAAKTLGESLTSAKPNTSNILGHNFRSLQTREVDSGSDLADLSVDLLRIPLGEGLRPSGAAAELHFQQSAILRGMCGRTHAPHQ
jgi:hypothetical protein